MSYLYIFLTIFFTVYGQIVLKWQVNNAGIMPASFFAKFMFLFALCSNPWILSAFFAAFLASLAWMAAMTKVQLSFAYPFMSLSFIFVAILSVFLFNEAMTLNKIIALTLIITGIVVLCQ